MSGPGSGAAVPLSGDDLLRLCDFVYRRTGMSYGEGKRYYVERRVAQRIAASASNLRQVSAPSRFMA